MAPSHSTSDPSRPPANRRGWPEIGSITHASALREASSLPGILCMGATTLVCWRRTLCVPSYVHMRCSICQVMTACMQQQTWKQVQVAVSHSSMLPLSCPTASALPSGVTARATIAAGCQGTKRAL